MVSLLRHSWVHAPNDTVIGSAVFAGLTLVTNTQTDTHADHAACVTVDLISCCTLRCDLINNACANNASIIELLPLRRIPNVRGTAFVLAGAYWHCSHNMRSKKVKAAHTRLPSVKFWSWSRFLAVSLQVTWVINPAVGCHYFPPDLQLPPQPLRGLLSILLLGEQTHNGCEQFA